MSPKANGKHAQNVGRRYHSRSILCVCKAATTLYRTEMGNLCASNAHYCDKHSKTQPAFRQVVPVSSQLLLFRCKLHPGIDFLHYPTWSVVLSLCDITAVSSAICRPAHMHHNPCVGCHFMRYICFLMLRLNTVNLSIKVKTLPLFLSPTFQFLLEFPILSPPQKLKQSTTQPPQLANIPLLVPSPLLIPSLGQPPQLINNLPSVALSKECSFSKCSDLTSVAA